MSSQENKSNEQNMQPMMLSFLEDARMNLDKVAQVLAKINEGLSSEEKMLLKPELEGISYSAAIILMEAEMDQGII